tara:strand:- start:506 stop:913 length:408 start_codon:yes stop_codon:yes gene_type:complete
MIKLLKSSANDVILTLNEKNTITGTSYYLIEFILDDTKVSKLFTATDVSTNIERYNHFVITTTTGTEDLLTGTIKLDTEGYYTYNVYSQETNTNLLINNTRELVETGKMFFGDFNAPILTSYVDEANNTRIVYNG